MSDAAPEKEKISELVEFVRFSLKEGLSAEQIRESLLESGQSRERISSVFELVLHPGAVEKTVLALKPEESSGPLLCPEEFITDSSIEPMAPVAPLAPSVPTGTLPELELVTSSVESATPLPRESVANHAEEPKIELMAYPQRAPEQVVLERRPRGGMTDRELIQAYKVALKKKAQKKKSKRHFRTVVFWIAAFFVGMLFFRLHKR